MNAPSAGEERVIWWLAEEPPERRLATRARREHLDFALLSPAEAAEQLASGATPSAIWVRHAEATVAAAQIRALRERGYGGAVIAELPHLDPAAGAELDAAGADEELDLEMPVSSRVALAAAALRRARLRVERERALRELEGDHGELKRRHEELRAAFRELAHELRTPLTAAREFLEILLEGEAGPLRERQREFLEISRRSCTQMNERLENLLEMARLETGKVRLARRRAQLGEVVEPLLRAFAPRAERAGVQLRWSDGGVPAFEFDPQRLAQALENLVGNALKFAPRGSAIQLSAQSDATRRGQIELRVADRGPGIAPAEAERLFERGVQRQRADSEQRGGLGLGLAIAREIARLHGGELGVEPTPGGGATLVLRLPRDARRRAPSLAAR
ncbi:MAG: HAMP domain-containing histidine kinase [Planctomycetes bacterium]|nr:HAMP domain-containing histidine kinase [Planctomycetota bacterium]